MLRSSHPCGCLVAASLLVLAGGPALADEDEVITGSLVVRMLPGVDVQAFIDQFAQYNLPLGLALTLDDSIPARGIHLLHFDPSGLDAKQLGELEDQVDLGYPAQLAWGEFLYEGQAPEGRTGSFWLSVDPGGENALTGQFAAGLLGLPAAQKIASGTGTVVALLDTGIDAQHPLLAARIVAGGFDFVDGDALPEEAPAGAMHGHGTFVAGLIALVAPGAGILPIRVLDADGLGDNWTIAKGLYYAIDHGVEVINVSLGSTYRADAVEEAIDEARAAGITVVGAAGNQNNQVPEYPAMFVEDDQPLAIAVVATDDADVKAAFSSYGADVALAAPGTRALLAPDPPVVDPDRSVISALPGGGLGAWEGTSMSTAFVSGAAALIRAQHPEWPPDATTQDQVRSAIRGSVAPIDAVNAPEHQGLLGSGRLDVAAAVAKGPVQPALGDLDGNGGVDVSDLLALLAAWGQVHGSADLDGSGLIGASDLLILLAAWSS